MQLGEFNEFCESLTASNHVVQWGDAHVWKVGGKVFAIGGWDDDTLTGITFKTTPADYEFLVELDGIRPAPYLASRGFTWVQHHKLPGLSDDQLRDCIQDSYWLVAEGLSKKKRAELGVTIPSE